MNWDCSFFVELVAGLVELILKVLTLNSSGPAGVDSSPS